MPNIAFSTLACPKWTWNQLLANAAAAKYDGIEVRQLAGETNLLIVPEFQSAQLAKRRADLRNHGVKICGLASSVRFDYPERVERANQLQIGKAYVDLAAELEAPFVRVFGDVLPCDATKAQRDAVLTQIADGLNQLGEYAAGLHPAGQADHGQGIDILLETHGDFAETALVVALFEQIRSSRVGVLWDTHHPWRFFNEPIEQTFAQLRPWTRHTHWKDSIATRPPESAAIASDVQAAGAQAGALMSGHRHADYVLMGDGEFPTEATLRVLKNAGYDGWLSYEWEKMWHPEIADPEVALPPFPDLMRSVWSRV
jgi:sugar phosphate isomerase/epimerase